MFPALDERVPSADELVVGPDEADAFVGGLDGNPDVEVQAWRQFGGRDAYRITLGTRGMPHVFVTRPHAHEPAGTAACFEVLRRLVQRPDDAWSAWVLGNFRLSFLPDANPGGSQRAPVKFWDGGAYPNEVFFLWMFGEAGEKEGQRFPRVDAWDMRQVVPPRLVGIAYERLDEHTYVEPNRDHRSTFFRAYFALHAAEPVDLWLDLHQTEYVGSEYNCHINLPLGYDDLSAPMQQHCTRLGQAIHERWRGEGARPRPALAVPYRNNPDQFNFLKAAWGPISARTLHLVTEVQNNNPKTPVGRQVWLQLAAIDQALRYTAAHRDDLTAALETARSGP